MIVGASASADVVVSGLYLAVRSARIAWAGRPFRAAERGGVLVLVPRAFPERGGRAWIMRAIK